MQDNHPVWLFNESKHVGVDYSDTGVAADYDNRHQGFRDFEAEAEKIAVALDLSANSTVLDIGCGTGGLSVCLARKCKNVYAVDISQAMVEVLNLCNSVGNIIQNLTGITPEIIQAIDDL
ncbi:MAG TPA: methyltransferase domain-containing protein [bacterium]|nr:methyltransferase domain-containing protein [bacterium]